MRGVQVLVLLLSSVASSLAYLVHTPNDSDGWTRDGPQELTWERVSTDPKTFAVVLDNQHISGFKRKVVDKQVDGTKGIAWIHLHNVPTGSGFRVNLVKDAQSLDTILAQSSEFDITY